MDVLLAYGWVGGWVSGWVVVIVVINWRPDPRPLTLDPWPLYYKL